MTSYYSKSALRHKRLHFFTEIDSLFFAYYPPCKLRFEKKQYTYRTLIFYSEKCNCFSSAQIIVSSYNTIRATSKLPEALLYSPPG